MGDKATKKSERFLIKIGSRLEKRRVELKIQKAKLAEKVGMSRMQLNRVISGETNSSILRLRELSKALKMPLTELIEE